MTTWTGNHANLRRRGFTGVGEMRTYDITGISGDTGGTLTCKGLKILDMAVVAAYTAAAGIDAECYISANTIVVAYANPAAGHTIRVSVWGIRG